MTYLSVDVQQDRTQNRTDKDLSEGARTILHLLKTASQQSISSSIKQHEKLIADNAANDEESW